MSFRLGAPHVAFTCGAFDFVLSYAVASSFQVTLILIADTDSSRDPGAAGVGVFSFLLSIF